MGHIEEMDIVSASLAFMDGLGGPEHEFAWCDELAKWRDAKDA